MKEDFSSLSSASLSLMSEHSESMEGFGDLSPDEQRAQLHAIFAKCDKNHDDHIDLSEFADLWAALQLPEEDGESQTRRLGALFRQMDSNGDGVITFDEVGHVDSHICVSLNSHP